MGMIKYFTIGAAALLASQPALAGVYSDDLGKCMVKATTEADRMQLVRWIFMLMTASPAVASMSTVTDAQRQAADTALARLTERLIMVDCRQPAIDAFKLERGGAFETSFALLGQVAMVGLMNDPAVSAKTQGFAAQLDKNKFAEFARSAGLAPDKILPGK